MGSPSCPPSPAWDRSVTHPKSRSQRQRSATPKSPIMHPGPTACQGWDVTCCALERTAVPPSAHRKCWSAALRSLPEPRTPAQACTRSQSTSPTTTGSRPPWAPGTGPPGPHNHNAAGSATGQEGGQVWATEPHAGPGSSHLLGAHVSPWSAPAPSGTLDLGCAPAQMTPGTHGSCAPGRRGALHADPCSADWSTRSPLLWGHFTLNSRSVPRGTVCGGGRCRGQPDSP